jgi:hypothetical protein
LFEWFKVLYKPIDTLEKIRKPSVNTTVIILFMAIIQGIVVYNLINSDLLIQMVDIEENIPQGLLVSIITVFQLFVTFINVVVMTLIFKLISKFFFGSINIAKLMYLVLLSQIPIFIGLLINSFFTTSMTSQGTILSVFSLGYLGSLFTENDLLLQTMNVFELFDVWAALIIARGLYVFGSTKSLKSSFIIAFSFYFTISIMTTLLL